MVVIGETQNRPRAVHTGAANDQRMEMGQPSPARPFSGRRLSRAPPPRRWEVAKQFAALRQAQGLAALLGTFPLVSAPGSFTPACNETAT